MMANCISCGAILSDVDVYCPECGVRLQNNNTTAVSALEKTEDVISVWKFLLFGILFALPIIGIITGIIVVCSTKSKNLRNYAISALIISIISALLFMLLVFVVIGIVAVGSVLQNGVTAVLPDSAPNPDFYDFFGNPSQYDFFDYYFS